MCINFFWQNDYCQRDSYSFILANNRDEYWDKPTKQASFWGPNDCCFSARDEAPVRVGGTWLGMNTNGKVATLVNILGQADKAKKGRGFLVSDYIASDVSMHDYALSVAADMDNYRGFNLLLFDLNVSNNDLQFPNPICVTNSKVYPVTGHVQMLGTKDCMGLSNSTIEHPFRKVERGKKMFRQTIKAYPYLHEKEYLIDSLLHLLSDTTRVQPDYLLESAGVLHGSSLEAVKAYSSIHVSSPQERLGSRTSTVILIDSNGKVDFVEKNYIFSCSPEDPDITICRNSFLLNTEPGALEYNSIRR